MAIGKPRGKKGMRPVYVYSPEEGRKVYVGSAPTLKEARSLFREKSQELAVVDRTYRVLTCRQYVDRWLELKHGPGTKRPADNTRALNASMIKPFLRDFGDRPLKSIRRQEALDWSLKHPRSARTASAMYNDAFDDELVDANPFRNRRQTESRGRRDIHPLTEAEVDRLGEIAMQVWKGYGPVCRAWIMFSAWVCSRPGETFSRTWDDLDFENGLVRVTRVKGRKQTEWIVFPERAQQAVLDMKTRREGLVFSSLYGKPLNKGSYGYNWKPVRAAFEAGLDARRRDELLLMDDGTYRDLDLYELRHFGASILVDRGLNEYDVAHQLGNSPEVCRKTYIHVHHTRANDRIRQAMNAPDVIDLATHRSSRGAS